MYLAFDVTINLKLTKTKAMLLLFDNVRDKINWRSNNC